MSIVEKLNVSDGMGFWNRTQQNEKVRSYLGDVSVLNVLSYIPGVQSVVGVFRIWDAVDALTGTDRLENVDRKDVKKFAWVQIARGLSELTGIFGYIFAIADIWSTISRAFKSNQQAKPAQPAPTQTEPSQTKKEHSFVNREEDTKRVFDTSSSFLSSISQEYQEQHQHRLFQMFTNGSGQPVWQEVRLVQSPWTTNQEGWSG